MYRPFHEEACFSTLLNEAIETRNFTIRTKTRVRSAITNIEDGSMELQKYLKAQTMQDLISSEETFLNELKIIMQYFMEPLSDQYLLDPTSHTTLFDNIRRLYKVNCLLVKELYGATSLLEISNLLVRFSKFHLKYGIGYRKAIEVLQNIPTNNPIGKKYICAQENKDEVNNKLCNLLITPLKRSLAHKKIIKESVLYTCPQHNDYTPLKECLNKIEGVTVQIETLLSEYEAAHEQMDWQTRFIGTDELFPKKKNFLKTTPREIRTNIQQCCQRIKKTLSFK